MQVLEEKMTAKIMKEAREQNEDLEAEENVILASSRNQSHQVPLTRFWQLLQASCDCPMDYDCCGHTLQIRETNL